MLIQNNIFSYIHFGWEFNKVWHGIFNHIFQPTESPQLNSKTAIVFGALPSLCPVVLDSYSIRTFLWLFQTFQWYWTWDERWTKKLNEIPKLQVLCFSKGVWYIPNKLLIEDIRGHMSSIDVFYFRARPNVFKATATYRNKDSISIYHYIGYWS